MRQIFVSFSLKDKVAAQGIIDRLEKTFPDFRVWYDFDSDAPQGDDGWDKLVASIASSDVFIYVYSNEANESRYGEAELSEAQRRNIPIVIIKSERFTPLPPKLNGYLVLNWSWLNNKDKAYKKLVMLITGLIPVSDLPAVLHPRNQKSRFKLDVYDKVVQGGIAFLFIFFCAATLLPLFNASDETLSPIPDTPSPTLLPDIGPDTNADWSPVLETVDGVTMVQVPAGCFHMGEGRDLQCIMVDFWIDQYEVSNAEYLPFLQDEFPEFNSHIAVNSDRVIFIQTDGVWAVVSGYEDYPLTNVNWEAARNFCLWRDSRLPTEVEWEYAARGVDSWRYPWGDEFDGSLVNYCDNNCTYEWRSESFDDGYAGVAPVTAFASGASWVGAYQMVGNVWEWTMTPYRQPVGNRILRGGSYTSPINQLQAAYHNSASVSYHTNNVGFRCARDTLE